MNSIVTPETDIDSNEDLGLNRHSLSERIYSRLRVALMTGQYEPGARLNIRGLAATYNTSPTPVREAIFQLVREGALEIRLGHQPRVPVLSIPQYINIRETRVPLERLAAELAVVRISDEDIARLSVLHQRFIQSEKEERWKEALAANQEFHFTIYRACGNDVLVRYIENLWLLAYPFVNNQYPITRPATAAVHLHLLIVDALNRRSPAETGDLVTRDLREGSYNILQRLSGAENGDDATPSRRKKRQKS